MISGYVTYKSILARLYSELGSLTEIQEDDCIEWIADALSMIDTFSQYIQINTILEMDEGKAKLPLNFYKLVDITHNNKVLMWSSNSFIKDYACDNCLIPQPCNGCGMHSFYINGGFLITDIKTTSPNNKICLSYIGVPVDEEGYPLIPDDIYFFKACVAYIIHRIDYREWRKGNITKAIFDKSESEWLFYVSAARGSANLPDIAKLENLKNIIVRLIPKQNDYFNSFRNINDPEKRRRFQ